MLNFIIPRFDRHLRPNREKQIGRKNKTKAKFVHFTVEFMHCLLYTSKYLQIRWFGNKPEFCPKENSDLQYRGPIPEINLALTCVLSAGVKVTMYNLSLSFITNLHHSMFKTRMNAVFVSQRHV